MKKAMFEELLASVREGGAILRGLDSVSPSGGLKALIHSYSFTVSPLTEADGGGYFIEFPDLPGCISEGETPEQAVANGYDAVKGYLLSCVKHGDPIPKPSEASGQWRQRVPKSMHARLVAKARQEGVSLNTLVTTLIAEGLGQRRAS